MCNGPGPSKCGDCSTGYTRNEKGACEGVSDSTVQSHDNHMTPLPRCGRVVVVAPTVRILPGHMTVKVGT